MTMKFDPKTGEWIADDESPEGKSLNAIATRVQKIEAKYAKPKKSVDEIYNEISENEIYGYALRLYTHVREMMEMHQLKERPVFRNRRGSYHKWNHKTEMGHIVFGYESLQNAHNRKFNEYKSVQHVWNYAMHSGKRGVYQLVLHEMAHNLQHLANGRDYGSVHNQCFCEKLDELITLFPYDEVENI